MAANIFLFSDLLQKSEKILTLMGIWPSKRIVGSISSVFKIIMMATFIIAVIIKNVTKPEKESIENALSQANGGFLIIVYLISLTAKKEKFLELFELIKMDLNWSMTIVADRKFLIDVGFEFQWYLKRILFLFLPAVLLKLIQPFFRLFYIMWSNETIRIDLPPSMALSEDYLGKIPTYLIETIFRTIMIYTVVGMSITFMIPCLHICTQFKILAKDFQAIVEKNPKSLKKCVERHEALIQMSKLYSDLFQPYFITDCIVSGTNLSILMFSLIVTPSINNYLMETPLLAVGLAQIFVIMYFGDQLIYSVGCQILINEKRF
jgi:hypothetical protein